MAAAEDDPVLALDDLPLVPDSVLAMVSTGNAALDIARLKLLDHTAMTTGRLRTGEVWAPENMDALCDMVRDRIPDVRPSVCEESVELETLTALVPLEDVAQESLGWPSVLHQ